MKEKETKKMRAEFRVLGYTKENFPSFFCAASQPLSDRLPPHYL